MPTPAESELKTQLTRLHTTGFDQLLSRFATANGLSPAFIFAIASRETNCRNILGDIQHGQAHGVGIIQIDIQHPIALQARDSGTWQSNPGPLIDFGTKLLAADVMQVHHVLPSLPSSNDALHIAAAGYNCGIGTAIQAARAGDPDSHTTGKDYGKDVIARMLIFQALLAAS